MSDPNDPVAVEAAELRRSVDELADRTRIAKEIEGRTTSLEQLGRTNRKLIVGLTVSVALDVTLSIIVLFLGAGLAHTNTRVSTNTDRVSHSSCIFYGLVIATGYHPEQRPGSMSVSQYRKNFHTIEDEYVQLRCAHVLNPQLREETMGTTTPTKIVLDAQVFAFLAGVVLPFLTAIIAKNTASSGTKAVINLVLSGVAGTIAVLATNAGHAVTAKELVIVIGTAWITAVATHFGLWKPTTATPKLNDATGSFGIGKTYNA